MWSAVLNVDLSREGKNRLLSLFAIPKPLEAKINGEGVGAIRTAKFSNGKSFTQEVLEWMPPRKYSFSFKAEPGFRVGYFFDLSKETFRIIQGEYEIRDLSDSESELRLNTKYELKVIFLLPFIHSFLKLYQLDLLNRIRRSCERQV